MKTDKIPEPKEFKEFLQHWLDWVKNGAPDEEPYDHHLGICGSYEFTYCEVVKPKLKGKSDVFRFMKQELGSSYPFDPDEDTLNAYSNPARIKWAEEYLNAK